MIVLTVLFAINMPSNCYRIMIAIMKLTNLDIVETEDILNQIFTFHVETKPISAVFKEAGYESSNFIIELGPLFLIICISSIIYLLRMILLKLVEKCGDNCLTRKLQNRIQLSVIIVRFLLESCIELGLVALIATVMVSFVIFATALLTIFTTIVDLKGTF